MIILQSNEINDFPNIWSLAFCMSVIYIYNLYILPYILFLYGPVLCIAYIFYFQGQSVCAYVYALRILRMHVYAYIYIRFDRVGTNIVCIPQASFNRWSNIYCIFFCAYLVNVCILIIYTYLACRICLILQICLHLMMYTYIYGTILCM